MILIILFREKGWLTGVLLASFFVSVVVTASPAVNKTVQFPFQSPSALPIVTLLPSPSEESIHVEYPTVYEAGGQQVMGYSAFGDDRRWRIKSATLQNDIWIRQGNLFNEKLLAFTGNYAFPFVQRLASTEPYRYALFFSAGIKPGEPYTSLWRSFSRDGVTWQLPSKLLEDKLILDPVITRRRGREVVIYTSKDRGRDVVRMATISRGRPITIYQSKQPAVGLYTMGLVTLNGKQIIFIETGFPGHIDWVATCFDAQDRLIPAAADSLASYPKKGDRWDSLRYGLYFYDTAGRELNLYYNGIAGVSAEFGGQIGHSKVDRGTLERLVLAQNCH